MDDSLVRFQPKSVFAGDLLLTAVDVGTDPEVDAGGAGVEFHAFLAVVHVLEIFLEERDVDDLAGDEVGVVEGGGEGFGVGVRSVTLRDCTIREKNKGTSLENRGRKAVTTCLQRYHQRLFGYLNSRTRWCRRDRQGSRRM